MFGSLGAPEVLFLVIWWLGPPAALWAIARSRGRSPWFAALGILSVIGLAVGIIILLAQPSRAPDPTGQ